ncbi:hypothetical protein PMIN04_007680 [Paraphaeosphaeria minitans]
MDSLRKLLPKRARRTYEADPKYELLHAAETDQPEPSLCTRCGNAAHASITAQPARLRIALQVTISLAVLALWTALVGFYLASNPHLLQQHRGPRSLADLFPMVQVDFQPDHRFVDSDPYDTPFWDPGSGLTDAMASNAWNYYGSTSSPRAIPSPGVIIPSPYLLTNTAVQMTGYTSRKALRTRSPGAARWYRCTRRTPGWQTTSPISPRTSTRYTAWASSSTRSIRIATGRTSLRGITIMLINTASRSFVMRSCAIRTSPSRCRRGTPMARRRSCTGAAKSTCAATRRRCTRSWLRAIWGSSLWRGVGGRLSRLGLGRCLRIRWVGSGRIGRIGGGDGVVSSLPCILSLQSPRREVRGPFVFWFFFFFCRASPFLIGC